MSWIILDVSPQDSNLLDSVYALWRRNRRRLGFLPEAAFVDRARASRLAVAIDTVARKPGGYVLYDLPGDVIKVIHLCVNESIRRQGIARLLVNHIRERHPYRRGIRLSCRRDYGLAPFWEALGFIAVSERQGRGSRRQILTDWQLSFGHETFFDWRPGEQVPFSIDCNVLRDLSTERSSTSLTRQGFPDWLNDEIEIIVTEETYNDINRVEPDSLRKTLRDAANRHARIRHQSSPIDHALGRLQSALRDAGIESPGESDLRQVAATATAGIQTFVTSDSDLLQRVGAYAHAELGVTIIQPVDVVARFDELKGGATYSPVLIANTDLKWREIRPGEMERLAEVFIAKEVGETAVQFRRTWQEARAQGASMLGVEETGGSILAILARHETTDAVRIPLLRIARTSLIGTLGRHILAWERIRASNFGLVGIRLIDKSARKLASALESEGFLKEGEEWVAICCPIVADGNAQALDQLNRLSLRGLTSLQYRRLRQRLSLKGELGAAEAAEVEGLLFPLKVMDAHISNLLVPIQARYAEQLFDVDLSRQKLFKGPLSLGTTPEQVYYRAPGFPSTFTQPARILWYVSEESGRLGTKAVRACSMLSRAEEDTPDELHRRYRQMGVFNLEGIRAGGRRGKACAMVFKRTELFRHPVSHRDLQKAATLNGTKLLLQTTREIPPELFRTIYEAGMSKQQ